MEKQYSLEKIISAKEDDLQSLYQTIATTKEELNVISNFRAPQTTRNENFTSQGGLWTTNQDSSTFRRLQQFQNTFQSISLNVSSIISNENLTFERVRVVMRR